MAISEIISCAVLCIGLFVMIIGGGMELISSNEEAEDKSKNIIISGGLITILGCLCLIISSFSVS